MQTARRLRIEYFGNLNIRRLRSSRELLTFVKFENYGPEDSELRVYYHGIIIISPSVAPTWKI